MTGWVSIHRRIRDHWVFAKPEYFQAWVIMIFEVNHKDKKVLIGATLIECKRGQSLKSLQTWTDIFGGDWTKQKVRTFFALLKNDKMINTENVSKTTRLTICNYGTYQDRQHDDNTQPNTEITRTQHDDNTIITSNNNDNNENNANNEQEENKSSGFKKPSIEEIKNYIIEKGYNIDADNFWNFYESKDWFIGKNKMKKWKNAVATWKNRGNQHANNGRPVNILTEKNPQWDE